MQLRSRREADPLPRPPGQHRAGGVQLLRHHLPRMRVGVRRDRRGARRPRDQAGGESRASAEPGRDLRPRPVGAAGALQPRSLPRAHGARGRQAGADHVGQGAATPRVQARRDAHGRHGRTRCLHQPGGERQLPGAPRPVARRLRHAGAHRVRRRRAPAVARGQSPHATAPPGRRSTSPRRSSSSRSAPTSWTTGAAPVLQQLAWAEARAKLADAPRLIYIGPRRSLTGLNADEWIPVLPGSELTVAARPAGQRRHHRAGGRRRRRAGRAAAGGRRRADGRPSRAWCSRARAAPTRPTSRSRSRSSTSRSATSAPPSGPNGAVLAYERVAGHGEMRALAERMAAGPGAGALRARRQPGVHHAQGDELRRRHGARAVQGELQQLPRRDDAALRPRAAGSSRPRGVGRLAAACRHASRCSSRPWRRCSTRARRPTC